MYSKERVLEIMNSPELFQALNEEDKKEYYEGLKALKVQIANHGEKVNACLGGINTYNESAIMEAFHNLFQDADREIIKGIIVNHCKSYLWDARYGKISKEWLTDNQQYRIDKLIFWVDIPNSHPRLWDTLICKMVKNKI